MIMDDREALILSWMNRALNAEENLDTTMAANVKLDARCRMLDERLFKAEAECERLSKDAERYRWARDQIYYKPPGYDGRKVGRWVWDWDLVSENGSDLDAAIDAALKEQP